MIRYVEEEKSLILAPNYSHGYDYDVLANSLFLVAAYKGELSDLPTVYYNYILIITKFIMAPNFLYV